MDDILTVPFSPEELVARTLAVMRRSYHETVVHAGAAARRSGDRHPEPARARRRPELHLTSLEQSLLYLLAANAGRLVTRDEILDHLWGIDYAAESNVVDRHVRNLRAKLQNIIGDRGTSPPCPGAATASAHRRGLAPQPPRSSGTSTLGLKRT